MIKNLFEVARGPAKLGKSKKTEAQKKHKRQSHFKREEGRYDAASQLDSMGPDARLVRPNRKEFRSEKYDPAHHVKRRHDVRPEFKRGSKQDTGKRIKVTRKRPLSKLKQAEGRLKEESIRPTGLFLVLESDRLETRPEE